MGKVFLRVALMQKLVGPKCPEKSNKKYVMIDTKGNWVDIPKLRIIARLLTLHGVGNCKVESQVENRL